MQPASQHQINDYFQISSSLLRNKWNTKSGCHYSCIDSAKGLQLVSNKYDLSSNIQLCNALTAVSPKLTTKLKFTYIKCLFHSPAKK